MHASARQLILAEAKERRAAVSTALVWWAGTLGDHRRTAAHIDTSDAIAEFFDSQCSLFVESAVGIRQLVAAEELAMRSRIARTRDDALRESALRGMILFAGSYSSSSRWLNASRGRIAGDRYAKASLRAKQLRDAVGVAADVPPAHILDDDVEWTTSANTAAAGPGRPHRAVVVRHDQPSPSPEPFVLRTAVRSGSRRSQGRPKGLRGEPVPYTPSRSRQRARTPLATVPAGDHEHRVSSLLLDEVRVPASRGARPSTVRSFADVTMRRLEAARVTAAVFASSCPHAADTGDRDSASNGSSM